MAKRDYYQVLGIDRDADTATIKKAYRSLALKYHPDRNPGDSQAAEMMKEINEAYAVLSDPQKRRQYDIYGHAGLEGYTMEDIFGGVDFGSLFREFGLGDLGFGFGGSIFDSFFGGGRTATRKPPKRGNDLRYDLEISLEEAAFGAEKEIEVPRAHTCETCKGSGAKAGGLANCRQCQGRGQIVTEQRTGFSVMRQITPCRSCHGTGVTIETPCDDCKGKGFVESTEKLSVVIPKGADSGYKIKVAGAGDIAPEGGSPGDLYVVITVAKHPLFERHGDDIYMTQEINFTRAALGGEIDNVPGLEGNLTVEIPEGTQNGTIFRVLEKGMPRLDGYGRGDQYVIAKVVTPTNLTEHQKELLREFERSSPKADTEPFASSRGKS